MTKCKILLGKPKNVIQINSKMLKELAGLSSDGVGPDCGPFPLVTAKNNSQRHSPQREGSGKGGGMMSEYDNESDNCWRGGEGGEEETNADDDSNGNQRGRTRCKGLHLGLEGGKGDCCTLRLEGLHSQA